MLYQPLIKFFVTETLIVTGPQVCFVPTKIDLTQSVSDRLFRTFHGFFK